MTSKATVGVGVVGLGFMGKVHLRAYQDARKAGYPCEIVAVCDQDPLRFGKTDETAGNISLSESCEPQFNFDAVSCYTELTDLLDDERVDLVSICTHTDSHVRFSINAFEAGKNVLIEKPVALTEDDIAPLIQAAGEHPNLICMPAHCVRFWPGWSSLKEAITEEKYGKLQSAAFERLSPPPAWSADFYQNIARSGSAIVDLHIHDSDFIQWCCGKPRAVATTGSTSHLHTSYLFDDLPGPVIAEGGWIDVEGFEFRMGYRAVFEKAALEYDSAQTPPLALTYNGVREHLPAEELTGYDLQVRHLLDAITGKTGLAVSLDDAINVAHLLDCERKSLSTGQTVET